MKRSWTSDKLHLLFNLIGQRVDLLLSSDPKRNFNTNTVFHNKHRIYINVNVVDIYVYNSIKNHLLIVVLIRNEDGWKIIQANIP